MKNLEIVLEGAQTPETWTLLKSPSGRGYLAAHPLGEKLDDAVAHVSWGISPSQFRPMEASPERTTQYLDAFFAASGWRDAMLFLGPLSKLDQVPEDQWRLALETQDPRQLLIVGLLQHQLRKANLDEVRRILHLESTSVSGLESSIQDRMTMTVRKGSYTDWLDLTDFLVNGDVKETYGDFRAANGGRLFSWDLTDVVLKVDRYGPRTVTVLRSGPTVLPSASLPTILHRFIQLSRRSKKLEKKLHSMPLQKVLQALSFPIPGHLLVEDTIDLLNSLKHATSNSLSLKNYSSYSSTLEKLMGTKWSNAVRRAGRTDDFSSRFLGYSFLSNTLITDQQYRREIAPLLVHALHRLGVEKTVETLNLIHSETDGICMRAFMELVRRGGFDPDVEPAWTAVLLPKN